MTKKQLNKLLTAQIEGKTVQVQMVNGEWRDVLVSELDSKCDFSFYRIKPDDIKRECKTCKNPYCSRTLEERQKVEVQVHTQYGWECVDKEKWLGSNGGFAFIKKEE